MRERPQLIVIVGPTASGKSDLAVAVAKTCRGEIISADSRQIYQSLTIGTGKVAGTWHKGAFVYKNIRHHCIDFLAARRTYSAAEFQECATSAIADIIQRGKTPIMAGGTAFWINAVVLGSRLPEVAPDARLRAGLEKKSAGELYIILKKLDPRRAATVEKKNPRRLIRAIEIARALGRVPKVRVKPSYHTLWLGLNPTKNVLAHRIHRRADAMIRAGLIAETQKLFTQKITRKRIRELGFEYQAALAYREGALTKKELHERLTRCTLRYARRQMQWWKRNRAIHWIHTTAQARRLTAAFLGKDYARDPRMSGEWCSPAPEAGPVRRPPRSRLYFSN